MGLGFRISVSKNIENGPNWSYSGFHEFRKNLAALVGIDLMAMKGYGGQREWPPSAVEPLVPLLSHSDGDGSMTAEECAIAAPHLRELLPKIEDLYDRKMAGRLVEAMEEVVRLDADGEFPYLEFC